MSEVHYSIHKMSTIVLYPKPVNSRLRPNVLFTCHPFIYLTNSMQ